MGGEKLRQSEGQREKRMYSRQQQRQVINPVYSSPLEHGLPRLLLFIVYRCVTAAAKSLQSCLTVRPHRRPPTRLLCPWDSPGKNTGVGCLVTVKIDTFP